MTRRIAGRRGVNAPTPPKIDWVRGDATGLPIPAHAQALREAGAEFLTRAFEAYGSLRSPAHIVRITRLEPCLAGSTGEKLFLSIEHTGPSLSLPQHLFIKFSRDFTSGFRDRRRGELESEIRLGELSRLPDFPICVPTPYFADFNRDSGTGLLITRRIAFGEGGIEPIHPKCMDHELEAPLEHYRAIILALARLAGAYKAGRLSPQVEQFFPYDAQAALTEDPFPWSEAELRERIARYAAFAADCPRLLPAELTDAAFIAKFEREALGILRQEQAIKRYLHQNHDFIALSHFNSHIDNAWFWREPSGALECGLLDWQRARPMNVAYALWGALSGAGFEIWKNHLDELLATFAAEFHAAGGPRLDLAELRIHLDLYTAVMGLAGLIETPAIVLRNLPQAPSASGPLDPMFRDSEAARSFLHVFTNFLNLWRSDDVASRLEDIFSARAVTP